MSQIAEQPTRISTAERVIIALMARRKEIPDWARKERGSDWVWIAENMHVLWPGAQKAFREQGKGALMIDTLTVVEHGGGSGNPMFYLTEKALEESEKYPDALRMVRAY